MPRTATDIKHTISTALEIAGDLGSLLLTHREEVISTAKLLRRKFNGIKQGLKFIGKKDKNEILSIGSFLENNAKELPNKTAILFEDQRYTHKEFNEHSNRFANLLASNGIKKGDAVAILLENRPEILFAVAGVVKIGAIAAVINTNQRKKVLLHSFTLCSAKMFIVGEELIEAFNEVRGDLEGCNRENVLFFKDSGRLEPPANMTDGDAEVAKASIRTPSALHSVTLGDSCFYIYTSGTTGLPKASIMSHFRWVKAAGAFGRMSLDANSSDIIYVALPFYHNNALSVAWSSAAASGAALAIRRKFSASQFWNDCRKFGATSFCYIGELCRYLMNQPVKPDDANNSVTKIVGNGLRPDIWKQFKQRFGISEVYEFYAASEGNIAFVNMLNLDCTVGLCPAPYAIVEYDVDSDEPVRGEDGFLKRVPRRGTGLLLGEVSEKYAFDGYTDRRASEKKLLRNVFEPGDVWFNSGDLLKDLGFKHAQFVDRVGDTFRWKSENVSTNEVAEVLNAFTQIEEATVYGVEIPGTEGRAGMAAIVATVGVDGFDFPGLTRHLKSELPAYASPVFLRFREQLDVTGTFKQKKVELRKQGFSPAAVTEPTFVMLPRTNEFVALTDEVFNNINSGAVF